MKWILELNIIMHDDTYATLRLRFGVVRLHSHNVPHTGILLSSSFVEAILCT